MDKRKSKASGKETASKEKTVLKNKKSSAAQDEQKQTSVVVAPKNAKKASLEKAPPKDKTAPNGKAVRSSKQAPNGKPKTGNKNAVAAVSPKPKEKKINNKNNPTPGEPLATAVADQQTEEQKNEYIIEMRRKLHREIFEKCLEKKMLQDMELWDT
jgi:hypothetical protein